MRKISDESQKLSAPVNNYHHWPIYEIFDDELKAIFDKHAQILSLDFSSDLNLQSNITNELTLGRTGLKQICDELHLSDHYDFIVLQLLPLADQRLNFENFQHSFVQVVTQIFGLDIHRGIEFNSPGAE
uniref:Uncharacterized protein n=1 Tax=Romanomermis culicivorax TaxID=13658 RepID=A0A915JV51_ROMCU